MDVTLEGLERSLRLRLSDAAAGWVGAADQLCGGEVPDDDRELVAARRLMLSVAEFAAVGSTGADRQLQQVVLESAVVLEGGDRDVAAASSGTSSSGASGGPAAGGGVWSLLWVAVYNLVQLLAEGSDVVGDVDGDGAGKRVSGVVGPVAAVTKESLEGLLPAHNGWTGRTSCCGVPYTFHGAGADAVACCRGCWSEVVAVGPDDLSGITVDIRLL